MILLKTSTGNQIQLQLHLLLIYKMYTSEKTETDQLSYSQVKSSIKNRIIKNDIINNVITLSKNTRWNNDFIAEVSLFSLQSSPT